jgi:hypothetical protein
MNNISYKPKCRDCGSVLVVKPDRPLGLTTCYYFTYDITCSKCGFLYAHGDSKSSCSFTKDTVQLKIAEGVTREELVDLIKKGG